MGDDLVALLALCDIPSPRMPTSLTFEPHHPHPSGNIVIELSPSSAFIHRFHFSRSFASSELAPSPGLLARV